MNTLNAKMLLGIENIFKSNGWPIEEISEDSEDYLSTRTFESFCNWIRNYSNEEQKLLLDLTRKFLSIQTNDYMKEIKGLFRKIEVEGNSTIESSKRLFFYNLKKEADKGETKSTDFIFYLFKSNFNITRIPLLNEKDIVFCNDRTMIDFNPLYDRIVFIDDFIGSGRQVALAIREFCEKHPFPLSSITMLALVSHCKGVQKLRDAGINLYTGKIINRGISDNYSGRELDVNLEIMRKIESRLKISKKFQFGFEACEALVAVARTPNDTFPVYWKKCTFQPICPFPRD